MAFIFATLLLIWFLPKLSAEQMAAKHPEYVQVHRDIEPAAG
jgi:hypothetical protein